MLMRVSNYTNGFHMGFDDVIRSKYVIINDIVHSVMSDDQLVKERKEVNIECPICLNTGRELIDGFECNHKCCSQCIADMKRTCRIAHCPYCRSKPKAELPVSTHKTETMQSVLNRTEEILTATTHPLLTARQNLISSLCRNGVRNNIIIAENKKRFFEEACKFTEQSRFCSGIELEITLAELSNNAERIRKADEAYNKNYLFITQNRIVLHLFRQATIECKVDYNNACELYNKIHRERLISKTVNPNTPFNCLASQLQELRRTGALNNAYGLTQDIMNRAVVIANTNNKLLRWWRRYYYSKK
jgi:hypothetical protein